MGKSILVVDDAMFVRTTIRDILTQNGFDVVGEASNGVEALTQYQCLNPDLVIMDITMPEMDGIQATREIKKINRHACIIICSAMGQQSMVIESLRAGATDFVVKPFQPERLVEAVKKVLC